MYPGHAYVHRDTHLDALNVAVNDVGGLVGEERQMVGLKFMYTTFLITDTGLTPLLSRHFSYILSWSELFPRLVARPYSHRMLEHLTA